MNNKNTYIKTGLTVSVILMMLFTLCLSVYGQDEEGDEREGQRLTREAQLAMVEAQELMSKEEWAAARAPILSFLSTGPEYVPEMMYLLLGAIWISDEKAPNYIEEAIKVYEKGYNAYPDSENMTSNYAKILYMGEKFAKAGAMFEKYYDMAIKKDLKDLNNAAGCFYMAEELDEAKRVYKRMIKLSEGNPEKTWYTNIISISIQQKNVDEAEGYIMEALNHFPVEVNYWNLLAMSRQDREDLKGATSAYEIVTHIKEPEKRTDWNTLISFYNYLNVPLRVADKMQKSLKNETAKDEDHINIANFYARAMKIDEAVAYLDKQIGRNSSIKLKMEKAKILFNDRRNKQALEALDDVIKADSKFDEAYLMKGWVKWDQEEWNEARAAFRNVLSSSDKSLRDQAKNAIEVLDSLEEAKNN